MPRLSVEAPRVGMSEELAWEIKLWLFIAMLRYYEEGLVDIIIAIMSAQNLDRTFTALSSNGYLAVSSDGRRITNTKDGGYNWAYGIMTPGRRWLLCWRLIVHECRADLFCGVIATIDPGRDRSCEHATSYTWRSDSFGRAFIAGKRSQFNHGGWKGFKNGDEAALLLDVAARTLTMKHRRTAREYSLTDLVTDTGEWFIHVCMGHAGDSVEVMPLTLGKYAAFLDGCVAEPEDSDDSEDFDSLFD